MARECPGILRSQGRSEKVMEKQINASLNSPEILLKVTKATRDLM